MSSKIGGERPRPRVYLTGDFKDEVVEKFERMFPTILLEDDKPDIREIDLIIIGDGITKMGIWPWQTHVICFSIEFNNLPGPTKDNRIEGLGLASTEEFILPETVLPFSRRRESDFIFITNIKNWLKLSLRKIIFGLDGRMGSSGAENDKSALKNFHSGSIINERVNNTVLASIFIREKINLGVAWLPNIIFNRAAWVETIVTEWAKIDKESFPQFSDWTNSPEWLTSEEEKIMTIIDDLENKQKNAIHEFDKKIEYCVDELSKLKKSVNEGRRRLITAQAEELVEEVGNVFAEIGFEVELVDDSLEKNVPKKEDIRIRDYSEKEMWEAIVEVRGYSRSGGKNDDLLRLGRFEKLFHKEKGDFPDKKIYIVNGQTELLPSQRQDPLSREDVNVFGDDGGLVIWTLDLFRIMKKTPDNKYDELKDRIKKSVGRWQ